MDSFVDLLFLGIALSLDSFAVALSLTILSADPRHRLVIRYISVVALFHMVMPIIGWFIGDGIAPLLGGYGNKMASIIFLLLGGKTLWDALSCRGDESAKMPRLLSIVAILILALMLSIDALVAGFSLGVVEFRVASLSKVWSLVVGATVVGVVTFCVTWMGFFIGSRISPMLGRVAPVVGGVMLILLGLKIIFEI